MNQTHDRSTSKKVRLLLSLLPRHPVEFIDRVAAILDVQWDRLRFGERASDYSPVQLDVVLAEVERVLQLSIEPFLQEPALDNITHHVVRLTREQSSLLPFPVSHNASLALARLCYAVCRALKPKCVVETGVAYGVTSAFLLQALQANNLGQLHSIDLPPLGDDADRFVGWLIPDSLRPRWTLHRGASKRILKPLLKRLGGVDLYIHDSLHTYENIIRELQTARPFLSHPSLVIVDDIDDNPAFLHWASHNSKYWNAIHSPDKRTISGLGILE